MFVFLPLGVLFVLVGCGSLAVALVAPVRDAALQCGGACAATAGDGRTAGLILAVTFVPLGVWFFWMGGGFAWLRGGNARLQEFGVRAHATVVTAESVTAFPAEAAHGPAPAGAEVPLRLALKVQPREGEPFGITGITRVPADAIPRRGDVVTIVYDRRRPERFALSEIPLLAIAPWPVASGR